MSLQDEDPKEKRLLAAIWFLGCMLQNPGLVVSAESVERHCETAWQAAGLIMHKASS